MEFETIDGARGDLLGRHFQGQARLQRSASPFGDHPAVFAAHFGDVDEGDWAEGY